MVKITMLSLESLDRKNNILPKQLISFFNLSPKALDIVLC